MPGILQRIRSLSRPTIVIATSVSVVAAAVLVAVLPATTAGALNSNAAPLIQDLVLSRTDLAHGYYVATPAQRTSIQNLEDEAVTETIQSHGLADSPNSEAQVQSWGRPYAEAQLWALLSTAIQTAPAARTTDQANAVAWLATVIQRRNLAAAQNAGIEYARWAGLGASAFQSLLATSPSHAQIQNYLSAIPNNYGSGEGPTTPAAAANEGYCVYSPPAPLTSSYTGNIYTPAVSNTAPIQCFTRCPEGAVCDPPTPALAQFVQWGQADSDQDLNTVDFLASSSNIISAVGWAGATIGGGLAGGVVAATIAPALVGTALAGALSEGGLASSAAISAAAAAGESIAAGDLSETIAEIAATSVGAAVGIIIAAVTTAVLEGINVFDAAAIPGQLADLITGATATPDLASMMTDPNSLTTVFSAFVAATLPNPVNGPCEAPWIANSLAPCLGTPAADGPNGTPAFAVTAQGSSDPTDSSTLTWHDAATGIDNSAYLALPWFVDKLTSGSNTVTV